MSRTQDHLPQQPEELTAGWFAAALAPAYPGTVVEQAQVVDVITGISTKIRVALHGRPGSARRALLPRAAAARFGAAVAQHRSIARLIGS